MITRTPQEIEADAFVSLLNAIKPSVCASCDAERVLSWVADVPNDPMTADSVISQHVEIEKRWLEKEMNTGSRIKRFIAGVSSWGQAKSDEHFMKEARALVEGLKAKGKTEMDFLVSIYCYDHPQTAKLISEGKITTLKQLYFCRMYEEKVCK